MTTTLLLLILMWNRRLGLRVIPHLPLLLILLLIILFMRMWIILRMKIFSLKMMLETWFSIQEPGTFKFKFRKQYLFLFLFRRTIDDTVIIYPLDEEPASSGPGAPARTCRNTPPGPPVASQQSSRKVGLSHIGDFNKK